MIPMSCTGFTEFQRGPESLHLNSEEDCGGDALFSRVFQPNQVPKLGCSCNNFILSSQVS